VMRLCLYGGPGVGKSLLSLHLAERLRRDGYGVELVQEAIKPFAYRGTVPGPWHIKDIFDEQLRRERDWIYSGVPHLVTDSPLLIQCYYFAAHAQPEAAGCLQLARAWERDHEACHVLLERSPTIAYRAEGRYQDLAAARKIDGEMRAFLESEKVPFVAIDAADRFAIREHILGELARASGSKKAAA
jgi:hypothetical protein